VTRLARAFVAVVPPGAVLDTLDARVATLTKEAPSLRWLLLGETPAGQIVRAAFFGFGTILTLLTVRGGGLYAHYMIVLTPIMTPWVGLLVHPYDR